MNIHTLYFFVFYFVLIMGSLCRVFICFIVFVSCCIVGMFSHIYVCVYIYIYSFIIIYMCSYFVYICAVCSAMNVLPDLNFESDYVYAEV